MSTFRKEGLFSIAIMSLIVLFWQQTDTMKGSAAMFPRILLISLTLLVGIMLFQAFRHKQHESKDTSPINIPLLGKFLVLIIAYVLSAEPIGYFIVTPIFIVIGCTMLKAMGFVGSLCVGVLFSVFIYFLFVVFLYLPVPLGILENILSM